MSTFGMDFGPIILLMLPSEPAPEPSQATRPDLTAPSCAAPQPPHQRNRASPGRLWVGSFTPQSSHLLLLGFFCARRAAPGWRDAHGAHHRKALSAGKPSRGR